MRTHGVIFDLFGTLVFDEFSSEKFPQFQTRQASILGLRYSDFDSLWRGSFPDRILGKYPTLQENIHWVGEQMGEQLNKSAVDEVADNIIELTRRALRPRENALDVLRRLKQMGFKTALLSDCGPAVPLIWNETPLSSFFDSVAFSCVEKHRKPDPLFYKIPLNRLGLDAAECVYVGDGYGEELTGAGKAGMKPILIYSSIDPEEPERLVVKDWEGITIRSLPEIQTWIENE